MALFAALAGAAPAGAQERAIIAFADGGPPGTPTVFQRIAARQDLAFALMSATQGPYSVRQFLLDTSAGSRTSRSTYDPRDIPPLRVQRRSGGWRVLRWSDVRARADSAPAPIAPGLLAEAAGGATFVGDGLPVEAILAADRDGRLAGVSLGAWETIPSRVQQARSRLVVTLLPRGRRGERTLDALRRGAGPRTLLVVVRRPPRSHRPQLMAIGIGNLAPQPALLRSSTTRRDGLVAAIDIAPTVLEHLGVTIPDGVRGRPMTAVPGRDIAGVRRLERRLRVVFPRRFPAMFTVVLSIALLGAALTLVRRRALALRLVGLAFLWIPALALVGAALAPRRTTELVLMGGGTIALAWLTDRLVGWPRAPAVPALTGVCGYVADLAAGSELTIRSLLGPNPRFGARFYGVGNELEAVLPALLLIGLAALLAGRPRGPRLAAAFGGGMLALAAAMGWGRMGADVGGVITAGAGGAAAVLIALGARAGPRTVAIVLAVPLLGLIALAGLDLATGGDSHFTRNVLGDGSDDFADTIRRRYSLAWDALLRGFMPVVTLLAAGAVAWGLKRRDRLLRPLQDGAAWAAALGGGVAGGVVGTLTNDSGPVLLVLGVVVLGAAVGYLHGPPTRNHSASAP